jgi:hypothetical protein
MIHTFCSSKICPPLLSCIEGLFPFPYADLSSLFDESRAKNTHFSTYTHPICYTTCVYRLLHYSPHTSGFVLENTKWSWVSMSRQEIFDPWPSTYWKCSDSTLQFHFEDYKITILSYGKEEKAFNFESKVTLEKLLHIESASICPSSLNIVFIPQALSLLLREPHCLSPMSLPLVED